jgi:hypothetical protein
MGNNAAYSAFEHTIITIYNYGVLTLDLLDELAKEYEDTDIDSGGSRDLKTKDGKTLEDVCIGLVDPTWVPVKNESRRYGGEPEHWEWYERYDKWKEITDGRWGWR